MTPRLSILPTAAADELTAAAKAAISQRLLASMWLEDLEDRTAAGQLAPRTAEVYRGHVSTWLDWLDRTANSRPTPADVLRYVGQLRTAGKTPATVNAHLSAIRALYAWAETRDAYPAIGRSVRGAAVRKDEPMDCLKPEDVAGLLGHVTGAAISALRDRALIHVLFATGLRLVSLCGLNCADFDALDCALTYQGKGDRDKGRRAFLPPAAIEALRSYLSARRSAGDDLAPGNPLFAAVGNRAGGERLTARSVRRIIVGLMERAGHVQRDGTGRIARPRVFSAHSLRRSAITAAYDAAGLDAAQTLAGHADPKTTRRAYARVQKGRVLRELTAVLDLSQYGRRAL
jgi:site-specific recombinase XerD